LNLLAEHEALFKMIRKAEWAARKIHEKSEAISTVRHILASCTKDVRQRVAQYRQQGKIAP